MPFRNDKSYYKHNSMIRINNIKVGDYEFLYSDTFILSNVRGLSFNIADNTPQELKITVRLSDKIDQSISFSLDGKDKHHLNIVIRSVGGEKKVSREYVQLGYYDDDSKPLYMSFFLSALNETASILIINFYTLKHGEDIG